MKRWVVEGYTVGPTKEAFTGNDLDALAKKIAETVYIRKVRTNREAILVVYESSKPVVFIIDRKAYRIGETL